MSMHVLVHDWIYTMYTYICAIIVGMCGCVEEPRRFCVLIDALCDVWDSQHDDGEDKTSETLGYVRLVETCV